MIRAARLGVAALVTILVTALLAGVQSAPAAADTLNANNSTPITFSGNASGGGSAYPSSIQVSNLNGPITDVNVTVKGVSLKDLGEIRLMLVSPGNEAEILASAVCSGTAATNIDLTFDQAAGFIPGQQSCSTGTYRPHDGCGSFCPQFDGFPSPHNPSLANFNGENANGEWRLFAYRECGGFACDGTEQIGGGWTLSVQTGPIRLDVPAGTATSGPAGPYPLSFTIPDEQDDGVISHLEVGIDGVFHTFPDDLDIMIEKVGGPRVMLMSDACGPVDLVGVSLNWKDTAAAQLPDETSSSACESGNYRPTDHDPGDSLPGPAPAAPYATTLAAFDGLDVAGEWRLWVADDSGGDAGFITTSFELGTELRPEVPETTLLKAPKKRTAKRTARLRFTSDLPAATFQCRLDKRRWKACTSPTRLKGLAPGRHTFQVRAVLPGGQRDATPAVARWRVLR